MRNLNYVFTIIIFLLCGHVLASELVIPPLVPDEVLGTTGYYRWRHDNFITRHPNLQEPAAEFIPDYYLDYGEKYVIKFTDKLYPKLSAKGKPWLIRARLNLQVAIEDKCEKNPVSFGQLEEKPDSFRQFAFDSHQGAYLDAGLADLPLFDLIKIGMTPSIKDLMSRDGRIQIFRITKALGKDRLKKIIDLFRNIHTQARELVENDDVNSMNEAITLLEDMSKMNRNILVIYTGGFRQVRKAMKYRIHSVDDEKSTSKEWTKLLTRLENVR